jgi:hypothetical protein
MLSPDEYVPFDMYFCSLASMQMHPGAGTKDHRKLSLDECGELAVEMVRIRRKVTKEES